MSTTNAANVAATPMPYQQPQVKPHDDRWIPRPQVIAPKEPVLKCDQFLRKDWSPAIDRAYQQAAASGWTPEAKADYAKVVLAATRQDVRTRGLSPERAGLAVDTAADAGWDAKAANREDRRAISQAARMVFSDPAATAAQRARAQVLMMAIATAQHDDQAWPVPPSQLPVSAILDGPAGGGLEAAEARSEGRKDVLSFALKALTGLFGH